MTYECISPFFSISQLRTFKRGDIITQAVYLDLPQRVRGNFAYISPLPNKTGTSSTTTTNTTTRDFYRRKTPNPYSSSSQRDRDDNYVYPNYPYNDSPSSWGSPSSGNTHGGSFDGYGGGSGGGGGASSSWGDSDSSSSSSSSSDYGGGDSGGGDGGGGGD